MWRTNITFNTKFKSENLNTSDNFAEIGVDGDHKEITCGLSSIGFRIESSVLLL